MVPEKSIKTESEFKRVVTFCSRSGSQRQSHNLGLLFVDENGPTTAEIERLMQSPVLQTLFEGSFFGTVVSWNPQHYTSRYNIGTAPSLSDKNKISPLQHAILLSTTLEDFPTPATEEDNCPIYMQNEGAVYRFTVGEVYDKCLQMQKFVDCGKCALWRNCISTNLPTQRCIVEPRQRLLPGIEPTLPTEVYTLNREDWNNLRLKMWTSKLEGYIAVPSIATASDPVRPGAEMLRPFWQHRFDPAHLCSARDSLSSRADAGVKTRKTIQTQCVNCYFGGKTYGNHIAKCNPWAARRCEHGAWTEEMLVETTIDFYQRGLRETKFTLDDVWRLLFIAGVPFRKDRCLWTVSHFCSASAVRYSAENSAPAIQLSRVSRTARFEEKIVYSMEELKAWLPPELRARLDNPKPLDRHLLAVALQLSTCRYGKSYSYYYSSRDTCGYGNTTPNIRHICYHHDKIEQGVWGKTFERTHTFSSLKTVHDHYEFLPFFDIHELQSSPTFTQWRT